MDLSHLQDTAFDLNAAREIAESFTQALSLIHISEPTRP